MPPHVICIEFAAGERSPAEAEQFPLSSVLQQGLRTPIVAGCCTVVHGLSSGSCHGAQPVCAGVGGCPSLSTGTSTVESLGMVEPTERQGSDIRRKHQVKHLGLNTLK